MNKGVQAEKRPPPGRLCPYAFQGCNLPEGCALSRQDILAAALLPHGERPVGAAVYATRYPSERRKRVNAAALKCKYRGSAKRPRLYRIRRTRPQSPMHLFAGELAKKG